MLSETEERLMEELANTGGRAFGRLFEETTSNAVFHWNGQELGLAQITAKLMDPDREVRRTAAEAFTAGLETALPNFDLYFQHAAAKQECSGPPAALFFGAGVAASGK